MALTRESVLASAKRRVVPFTHADLAEPWYLRTLSVNERVGFEQAAADLIAKKESAAVISQFVALCLCDESGARLFADPAELGECDATIMQAAFEAARALNKMRPEDMEAERKN